MEEKKENISIIIGIFIICIVTALISLYIGFGRVENQDDKLIRASYKAGWYDGLNSRLRNPNEFDIKKEFINDSLKFEKLITE